MELSEEWKALLPIRHSFNSPLLSSSSSSFGPLIFNPKPKTLPKTLFSSPSLFPPLPPPPPPVSSLPHFLSTSASIPYCISSSISSFLCDDFVDDHPHSISSFLSHNRLCFLPCPDQKLYLLFFSTGLNHDHIGFLVIHIQDNELKVLGNDGGDVLLGGNHLNGHRIRRILVNPDGDESDPTVVGQLMAYTMYSVHWYCVKIVESSKVPVLHYLGSKLFKKSIIGCCWSPHLYEQSVVLLENGALFLFDISESNLNREKLRVSWDHDFSTGSGKKCEWLGCEFSWHPLILIVARSDAVFLADFRPYNKCEVTCLAKIQMFNLSLGHSASEIEKERFLALSRAGSDGFQFVLASRSSLLLCDVRKPMMPLLHWAHTLDSPCYVDVYQLSELRSQARDDRYGWATASGFCILLGSFWNCEFNVFCYGPSSSASEGSVVGKGISKFCKPFIAWDLPSDLLLSSRDCPCGSCLVKQEALKDALPEGVDWRQKKEIVVGFGILNREFRELMSESDEFGGFTLVRLMSSGKIEAQRYCASWDSVKKSDVAHTQSKESWLNFGGDLLYSFCDAEYKFHKKFKFLKLDYLKGYLNGKLAEIIYSKMKMPSKGHLEKEILSINSHEILCKKLKACGFARFKNSPVIGLDDISVPTSIYEIGLKQMWATLPMELLQLAFSSYRVPSDDNESPSEFLAVPDIPQLPPFLLRDPSSHSSSSKVVQANDSIVGPLLPLPVLLTLNEFRNGRPNAQATCAFSSEVERRRRCNEVLKVVSDDDRNEKGVDSQKSKRFLVYHPDPVGVEGEPSAKEQLQGNSVYTDKKFHKLISKVKDEGQGSCSGPTDGAGLELFDDLCPIKLEFNAPAITLSSQELRALKTMKEQFSNWQKGFKPYQELRNRRKF
ncbi:uncharacterized protein LOC111315204 [Durio zibethinus]|uniref:Uncharacterized protein LOC111315204 n=1 Tax=Durio zibethinus TaxID=66656 RepID=A0A6P6B5R5_DURZI|nr:uncharacterized protein LOC111315204 [Durio zibethinus]